MKWTISWKINDLDPHYIGKEIIWNNSNITDQNKKTFFYHKWYDRGIKFIDHIYDYRIQRFYNFSEFKDLYQTSEHDYLKYTLLIHNIPKTWKAKLASEGIIYNLNNCLIHKTNEKTKFSKFVTKTLVESKCPNVNLATNKWDNHFGNENVNWPKIFKAPLYISVDTNLREFQYKYLMHKIPNNQFLFKCKLKSHNICDFCNMCIDSNYHMFWECHIHLSKSYGQKLEISLLNPH